MSSIYDGLPYLYAEQLKGKAVTMTIKKVTGDAEFFNDGRKSTGFDIHFEKTDKKLGVVSATVRRQLYLATGTDDPAEMAGKKITVYPVKSARSASGQAIRIKIPEMHA
jgi:hypothetical protein